MTDIMKKSWGLKGFDKRLYRKEVSRLSAIANKRIQRLEKNDLTDSPAYRILVENGGAKFGVKGKTFNQVQQEFSRLNRFLNSETSTIRGINKNLKEMAKNTGVKYENLKQLKQMSGKFFELASKVEQYLRVVEDMASAIGYQKIWEAINEYIEGEKINLAESETPIEEMTEMVTKLLDNKTHGFLDKDFKDGFVIL